MQFAFRCCSYLSASEVDSCEKDPATSGRAYVEKMKRDRMIRNKEELAKEASRKWWSKWVPKALKDYGMFNHNQGSSSAKQRAFVENGSKLLEKLIATCNGKSTPIRNFSYQDLKRATNNFDDSSIVQRIPNKTWYRGSFEGRTIYIKVDDRSEIIKPRFEVISDIVTSAMMSTHNNVLRLRGCCLETQVPYIVFEFAANGILADRIYVFDRTEQQYEPMAWLSKLKIAKEIAYAISYLHTAFSRPIIHRDIKMESIFLDQNDVAKLSGFGLSISIPQGETHVQDDVRGTLGYICPDYLRTFKATEKADVFSFGIILFELLTGERTFQNTKDGEDEDIYLDIYMREKRAQGYRIIEMVNPTILQGEGGACIVNEQLLHQIQAVLNLAFACTETEPEKRPTMVDVTKELRRIERSVP